MTALLLMTGCAKEEVPTTDSPELLLDVGSHELVTFLIQGATTSDQLIIFESGLGDDHQVWQQEDVAAEAAKLADVVLYDRSGYGNSTLDAGVPRDIEHLRLDLRAIVDEYSGDRPVVLVGHSLGGMVIRDFAIRYPEKTAALLFVDASHELYNNPTQQEEELIYNAFADAYGAKHGATLEAQQLREDSEYMTMLAQLPDIPVIAITSMKTDATHDEEDRTLWFDSKEALREGVSDFEHTPTLKSGHYIMLDEPGLVIAKLKELMAKLP